MDVKQCPDSSYVGRTPPNCDFKPCPGTKLITDVYPLFEGEKWGPTTPKKMTEPVTNVALNGFETKAEGEINQNQDARKFFQYYDSKLKTAGWSDDSYFAADGILGSQVGYKKDNSYIVLGYQIKPGKVTSKKNEPLQWVCPCKITYSIFTSSTQPIVGGDKDIHGCIGSAGYTWCEAKEKCLRSWEEKCQ